ncbi:hypothetical protein [Chromobacterium amazonense]|uniref:hypothetical protein n=1 Tax=Chromobacterium amazonense TaxID=1382803 RepID=UPI003F7A9F7E
MKITLSRTVLILSLFSVTVPTIAVAAPESIESSQLKEFIKPDGSKVLLKQSLKNPVVTGIGDPNSPCPRSIGPYPVSGSIPNQGDYWIAFGPYTTTCRGTHQAGFTVGNIPLSIRFEKQDFTGKWVLVSNSNYGYLNTVQSGGTFRFLIGAYGPADQQNWTLNVTYPNN